MSSRICKLLLISLFVHKVQQPLTIIDQSKIKQSAYKVQLFKGEQTANKMDMLINTVHVLVYVIISNSSVYDKLKLMENSSFPSLNSISSDKKLAMRNWASSTVQSKYELTMLNELNNKLFNYWRTITISLVLDIVYLCSQQQFFTDQH